MESEPPPTDLAELLAARQEMETLLRRLSAAVEQSPDSIVIVDLAGTIDYVNAAFTRVSGYAPQEVIGQDIRMLGSGETPREVFADLWATILAGRVWEGELINRRKDGSHFVELTRIAPIRSPCGGPCTHYLAIQTDVGEKKRLEAAWADAVQQAPTKGELLGNMSHEIRAPLNAEVGQARIGQQENAGRRTGETSDPTLAAGEHLLGVINDILDFSKIQAGKRVIETKPFATAAAVSDAVARITGAATGKGLKIEVAAPPAPAVAADDGTLLIDWAMLSQRFCQRESFIDRLLHTVLESQGDLPARLRAAAEQHDMAAMAFIGHTLKGTAGNIAAHPLQNLARQLDERAHAHIHGHADDGETTTLALQVADQMDAVLEWIRARLRQPGTNQWKLALHVLAVNDQVENLLNIETLLADES